MLPIFGNALIEPIINQDHAQRSEVIAWAFCLSASILFGGLAFLVLVVDQVRGRLHRSRRGLLLLAMAALFHVSGCYISSQDKWQEVNEKLAAAREAQKKAE